MYIFTWEVEDGLNFCETVVYYDNILKLAQVFEQAGYDFRVSSGTIGHSQGEFGACGFKHWLNPDMKFSSEL